MCPCDYSLRLSVPIYRPISLPVYQYFWLPVALCVLYSCKHKHSHTQIGTRVARRKVYEEQKELQLKLQKVRGQDGWRQRCEFDQASQELQLLGLFLPRRLFAACISP